MFIIFIRKEILICFSNGNQENNEHILKQEYDFGIHDAN